MPLSKDKQDLQDAAEDPRGAIRQAETERLNKQIQEIIGGQAVRKFCVEQAVQNACHQPGVEADKLCEALYRFMTADIARLH